MISSRFLQLTVAALCLLPLFGCETLIDKVTTDYKLDQAEKRVVTVLDNITKGFEGADEETAICMFYKGKLRLTDMRELGRADDEFVAWRKKRGLYRNVEDYEILEIEQLDDDMVFTIRVTAKINDRKVKFDVPEGLPFKWVRRGS